jgi:hypothetical protein
MLKAIKEVAVGSRNELRIMQWQYSGPQCVAASLRSIVGILSNIEITLKLVVNVEIIIKILVYKRYIFSALLVQDSVMVSKQHIPFLFLLQMT